jgi:hypothetical protein
LDRRLGGLQSRFGQYIEAKNLDSCTELSYQRKQAKLKWLQNLSKIHLDNLKGSPWAFQELKEGLYERYYNTDTREIGQWNVNCFKMPLYVCVELPES